MEIGGESVVVQDVFELPGQRIGVVGYRAPSLGPFGDLTGEIVFVGRPFVGGVTCRSRLRELFSTDLLPRLPLKSLRLKIVRVQMS